MDRLEVGINTLGRIRCSDPRGNEAGAGVTGKPVALRSLCVCKLTRRDPLRARLAAGTSAPPRAAALGALPAVLTSQLSSADLCPPAGPSCPDGWMGYRGKCYYFSETEGSWTDSRSRCCATGASLAGIDSEHEMAFLLRHQGVQDHWIGLRREQGQPWKWTNSTKFNHLFVIRGGGDCAYLNDLSAVSSLRCTSERHWICTKPDAFTQAQEAAVAGGS
ncbi:C-type lectin domain family 2 member D-like [Eretmochelys imbricata]